MKIAFHCNQLSIRGTEVAMYDYAHYNEKLLGNESIVLARNPSWWKYSDPAAIEKFKKRFPVYFYDKIEDIEKILDENQVDVFYAQKSGHNDGVISKNRKTVIHAVFQDYEPHGNVYAFISEWLSKIYGNVNPFVPYMVDLPNHNGDMREVLGIPKNALVFGRHGGYETFDIPWVKYIILKFLQQRDDVYFLFLNTEKFDVHPRIIHLPQISDLYEKTRFINTCDAMIHARMKGETFGLAVAEFSLRNKPIITYAHSQDMAHAMILGKTGMYYKDPLELSNIFNKADDIILKTKDLKWNRYEDYSPEKVMNKFKEVFL